MTPREGCDDDEGVVAGCDATSFGQGMCGVEGETTNVAEKMSILGSVRKGEKAVFGRSTAVFSPPMVKVSGLNSLFASCPMGRMLANIGEMEGITYPLRDGSLPVVERVSKFVSSSELRSEIFISDSAVRNGNNLVWMKNDCGEARKMCNTGKEMGFTLLGEEEVVLNMLRSIEDWNNRSRQAEICVSDDESN